MRQLKRTYAGGIVSILLLVALLVVAPRVDSGWVPLIVASILVLVGTLIASFAFRVRIVRRIHAAAEENETGAR